MTIKLGEVGCTEGQWWVLQTSFQQQEKLPCNSASDAVWSLWMVEVSFEEAVPSASTPNINEELLDRPFDELSDTQWGLLKKYEPLPTNVALIAA